MRAIVLLLALVLGLGSPARADDVAAAQGVIRAQERSEEHTSELQSH